LAIKTLLNGGPCGQMKHRDCHAGCYSEKIMSLPFDLRRIRAYELEIGAGGQRLGCKFLLDDGSLLFVGESEITSEIETLMASLGSPTEGLRHGDPVVRDKTERR
jgi:hypothetical protein